MNRGQSVTVIAVVVALVLSLAVGYYFGGITGARATTGNGSAAPTTVTTTQVSTARVTTTLVQSARPAAAAPNVVDLDIIPDYGGAGYDAFVLPTSINGSLPATATNTTSPGPSDNNITVSAGVPITFVITNLDTMQFNFSQQVSIPYTVYNDTDNGYVTIHYNTGQSAKLIASHTFTVTALGINIPTPPDTVVEFNYTFTKPGVYMYNCLTPCGPGMSAIGYMMGYIIVTS